MSGLIMHTNIKLRLMGEAYLFGKDWYCTSG